MSQLGGVLEEHPWPFVVMSLLFAVGAGLGIVGIAIARRRSTTSRVLGWTAVAISTMCNAVGVMTMVAAESDAPPVGALVRGMKLSDLEALQAHAEAEAHYCLIAGVMMGLVPFIIGVLALARSRVAARASRPSHH